MTQPVHKSPVALVPNLVLIAPVLGKIEVQNANLVPTQPRKNSTRWIFDIDGCIDTPVVIQLLDNRSSRPYTESFLIAGSFLIRSPEFYKAKPFIEQIEDGKLVLKHADPNVSCKYRICLDTMHSATR